MDEFFVGRVDALEGTRVRAGVGVISPDHSRCCEEVANIASAMIAKYRCSVAMSILSCRYGHQPQLIRGPIFCDQDGNMLPVR